MGKDLTGYGDRADKWLRAQRKKRKRAKRKSQIPEFFSSVEWKQLRYKVLKRDGGRCQLCGRSAHDGVTMNVDHIKPRHAYPKLAMDIDNLQTLCSACNCGKGAKDQTDWRQHRRSVDAQLDRRMLAELREKGL